MNFAVSWGTTVRDFRRFITLDQVIVVVALAMSLYHLVSVQVILHSPVEHQNTHLFFSLTLVFLSTLKKKKGRVFIGEHLGGESRLGTRYNEMAKKLDEKLGR